ncbi:gamma-glutamyl-gamma-aminobutyrate hydrolase family protein [Amycolatopsis panacis]|uniref:Gamma-glutamyl-gamma-aminobutyrate hydrolase family protein n=1 Tax=Amycolatopsis panacis TaxID=2340917 RepID=A0A419I7K2_9PSEU|nr:gamma-glutamyl-gamma-aminobutyrate hydrolase family protein [Amycolatopsis panacis]RJQ87865.1 gamma-glutamyl-gamma-aminobutyrate hydrolase family protein [Amycolatopsis panacis]
MARPLIAVSAPREEVPTAFGTIDCTKLTAHYTDAVYAAGGQPVVFPVTAPPPPDLVARMDGLMLTGGGDLNPALYGEAPEESVYGVRDDRDAFEVALYQEALALGLPILAICRGLQLVNVLRGGSLLQEIEGEQNHWQENPSTEPSHDIAVAAGSALAEVFGRTARVNSYHHQSVKQLGNGLRVAATCGDVIEAVEATDADLVGVQWHPEHMAATDPRQLALFESFVKRAAANPRTMR